jgi:hypothetical protein
LGGLALVSATGCTGVPERVPYEIDCDGPDGVVIEDPGFMDFEPKEGNDATDPGWWSSADGSPRSSQCCYMEDGNPELTPRRELIEGGRCGVSEHALHLRSWGHNDWGSRFGTWSLDAAPASGDGWDGIAVWARADEGTTRSVRIELGDRYTRDSGRIADPVDDKLLVPTCVPQPDWKQSGGECVSPPEQDPAGNPCFPPPVANQGATQTTSTESPATGAPASTIYICYKVTSGETECGTYEMPADVTDVEGATQRCIQGAEGQLQCGEDNIVPGPHDCENYFGRALTVSNRWELYLLPWDSFFQDPDPNRRPDGIDPSQILAINIVPESEANISLWLDDITFYRRTD